MPDVLLDVVKEDQTRAREAGKSARGTSGGSGRGVLYAHRPSIYALIGLPLSQVAVEHHSEVCPLFCLFCFLVTHSHIPSFVSGGRGTRGGPRGGRARGRGM